MRLGLKPTVRSAGFVVVLPARQGILTGTMTIGLEKREGCSAIAVTGRYPIGLQTSG
jgi:hypothetical protein